MSRLPPEHSTRPELMTTHHVRRAKDGDQRSIEWLVERLSPLLTAQARYHLGDKLRRTTDPEDLVHDAWVTTLPRIFSLPDRDGRSTPVLLRFLSTTILNHTRALLRGQARQHAVDLDDHDVAAEQSGPVSRAIRSERRSAVLEALESLEPGEREVVILRGIEQQPARLVSVLLGISEEAVSKRYRRALRKLQGRLPGSVFDELDVT